MDTETKNRIREFLETVIDSHDEKYPSCDGEMDALIDTVKAGFKIRKIDAQFEVLEFLWIRENI